MELECLQGSMPKTLSEYLYEETYNNVDFKTFIRVMAEDLGELQLPLQTLTMDVVNLHQGLERLGTGA